MSVYDLVFRKVLIVRRAAILAIIGGGAFLAACQETPAIARPPEAETQRVKDHDDHAHDHDEAHKDDDHGHDHDEEEGVVALREAQWRAAGIELVSPLKGGGGEARLSGRISPRVDAKAAVSVSVSGSVQQVLVAQGDFVEAGQAILALTSGDAAAVRAERDAAAASAEAARKALVRSQALYEQGIVARQEVETLEAQALRAEADARAATARARATGSPDVSGRVQVVSPISGVVKAVHVTPGGFVMQGGLVAEVTDPARVELVFNAPPSVAAGVKAGDSLRVNGGEGEFEAVVTGVVVDAGLSGSALIRARAEAIGNLQAGAPVTGSLLRGRDEGMLSVPSEAVQTVEGQSAVFVLFDGGFRASPVLTGRQAAGRTEILKGLTGDEKIAGANAFLLKAELAKGEAEHSH